MQLGFAKAHHKILLGRKSGRGPEIDPGEPLYWELNAREVAKYSDVGPVEGYISEMVQDTASDTIND